VERLASTQHCLRQVEGKGLAKLAKELGVQPDVLEEAQLVAIEARIRSGCQPPRGDKVAGSLHYQYDLNFPEAVYGAWKSECESRGLRGSAVLRSLIYTYLMGSWEPPQQRLLSTWVWRGSGYRVPKTADKKARGRRWPWRDRALIPLGAKEALWARAQRRGTLPAIIIRALVLMFIDREWATPGTLEVVDCRAMPDDPARYYRGE